MRKILLLLAGIIIGIAMLTTSAAAHAFELNTTASLSQDMLPALYTCDGKDISPELHWKNSPKNTQSFALILADPDAPSGIFYHWVLYNLPNTATHLPEGIKHFPSGTLNGTNSFGKMQYNGPCPPKGAKHRYIFTLYALDTTLTIKAGLDAEELMHAMEKHILDKAILQAVYSH